MNEVAIEITYKNNIYLYEVESCYNCNELLMMARTVTEVWRGFDHRPDMPDDFFEALLEYNIIVGYNFLSVRKYDDTYRYVGVSDIYDNVLDAFVEFAFERGSFFRGSYNFYLIDRGYEEQYGSDILGTEQEQEMLECVYYRLRQDCLLDIDEVLCFFDRGQYSKSEMLYAFKRIRGNN